MTAYEPPPGGGAHLSEENYAASATADETRSLGDIVGDIATDLSTLLKQELEVAKTEVRQEAARAGKGAGMFGGAGVAGLLTLIALTFTLIWLLDNWMPIELAALILTVVWGVIAAVLAQRGRTEFKRIAPPMETTKETLKEDVQWARAHKNS